MKKYYKEIKQFVKEELPFSKFNLAMAEKCIKDYMVFKDECYKNGKKVNWFVFQKFIRDFALKYNIEMDFYDFKMTVQDLYYEHANKKEEL